MQTITLDIRSEWKREIPIGNILEVVNFVVEFGRLDEPNAPVAQNLSIATQLDVLNVFMGIPVPFQVPGT